jgi:DDE superfamily endonuclease
VGIRPLPGAVHGLTAARIWGIIQSLAASGLVVLGDKGYLGEENIRAPYRGRNKPASQKETNRTHARLRAPGERANAQLKSWRILRKLRCCPRRAGQLTKAIHILQIHEIEGGKRFGVPVAALCFSSEPPKPLSRDPACAVQSGLLKGLRETFNQSFVEKFREHTFDDF